MIELTDIGHQLRDCDPWEKRNKVIPVIAPALLPGGTFQATVQGRAPQTAGWSSELRIQEAKELESTGRSAQQERVARSFMIMTHEKPQTQGFWDHFRGPQFRIWKRDKAGKSPGDLLNKQRLGSGLRAWQVPGDLLRLEVLSKWAWPSRRVCEV